MCIYMYVIICICIYIYTHTLQPTPSRPQGHWCQGYFDICNNNPHRLDHKGTGVKVTSIYVTITHTVSTTRALVSRLLRYIRYM